MRTDAARAASEIRKTLKANGIAATVKSKTYSMGDSVNVYVTDQTPWAIAAIKSALDKYEYGTFDGMTDCAGFKNSDFDGPQVKHLFINNDMSDTVRDQIWEYLKATYTAYENAPAEYEYNFRDGDSEYADRVMRQVFCNNYGFDDFWKKPRIAA